MSSPIILKHFSCRKIITERIGHVLSNGTKRHRERKGEEDWQVLRNVMLVPSSTRNAFPWQLAPFHRTGYPRF